VTDKEREKVNKARVLRWEKVIKMREVEKKTFTDIARSFNLSPPMGRLLYFKAKKNTKMQKDYGTKLLSSRTINCLKNMNLSTAKDVRNLAKKMGECDFFALVKSHWNSDKVTSLEIKKYILE
jgi:hypothetical protein